MEKLEKCPFCGGNADFETKEDYSSHIYYRVVCDDCGCGTWCDSSGYGHEGNDGKQLAITEWNQRV